MTPVLSTTAPKQSAPPHGDRPVPAVPSIDPAPVAPSDDSRAGRGAVIGGTIGFVIMAVGAFVLSMASDVSVAPSIGVGLFCAFWGGLGFGAMLGATISVIKGQARDDAAAGARS